MPTPLDRLIDQAHQLEACGCRDCGRAGLQSGPTHDRTRHWVSFVFIDPQGRIHRAEHDAPTLQQAAALMLHLEFDLQPA